MKLVDRLVFGSSRLTGGAYASHARRLLETCLSGGVLRYDTGPPYGMGSSEQIIGDVLGDNPDVTIHTKAGLPRPDHPLLLSWMKRGYNFARRERSAEWNPIVSTYNGPSANGIYTADAVSASIARSHRLLRRPRIDMLLLHEAEPADILPEVWALFETERDRGGAARIGFAHAGPARTQGAGLVVQTAPREDDFVMPKVGPRIYHTVRKGTALALRDGGEAASRIKAARSALDPRLDNATSEFLAGLLALARVQSEALFIFATTSPYRLRTMLEPAGALALSD